MPRSSVPILAAALCLAISACTGSQNQPAEQTQANTQAPAMETASPFAEPSTLPLQAPDFSKIKDSDYQPGFEQAMKQQIDEVQKIADNTEAPTFDNTLVALEKSGQMLSRVNTAFNAVTSANTNDALQKVQEAVAPQLAATHDAIYLNQKLFDRIRLGFLIVTLVWLGWIAQAQLSVVNVLTFFASLRTGFQWESFLIDPLIFILWCSIAAALLFWGRGPFCGWLCPFGALQELSNRAAKALKVPQIKVPWGLHERLVPIKYILFLGLFAVSLGSLAFSEVLAEVEPFKTAIVLRFMREWWFVAFAVALLVAGLFIERFFCRYLCPLGAALAIPGRMRMFEWLKRYRECGNPCQRCYNECPVEAIHPEGHINPNECIGCMHCQVLYHHDRKCPVMIQRRVKREKRDAMRPTPQIPDGALPAGAIPIHLSTDSV